MLDFLFLALEGSRELYEVSFVRAPTLVTLGPGPMIYPSETPPLDTILRLEISAYKWGQRQMLTQTGNKDRV